MALLLRKITKPKWNAPDWLKAGEVPADALGDLKTTSNGLSVWAIEVDRSNLSVALTALAAARQSLDKLDYALVDESALAAIPIRSQPSEGDTPDKTANVTIHRDLVELTAQKVCELASKIMLVERFRVTERQVEMLLKEGLRSGKLDRSLIDPNLLGKLEPSGTSNPA